MTKMITKSDEVSRKAVEILKKSYARRLVPDETGGYVTSIHEFPGCIAEGDTAQEAIKNLDLAAISWVEAALVSGYPIREPVSFHGYSGKIALRLPRGLHKQVAELAELEDCSVNQLLVNAIAQYLGSKNSLREFSGKVLSEIKSVMSDGVVSIYRNNSSTLTIAFSASKIPVYRGGTTIDGTVITEKQFNLGGNLASLNQRKLGVIYNE